MPSFLDVTPAYPLQSVSLLPSPAFAGQVLSGFVSGLRRDFPHEAYAHTYPEQ